MTEHPADLEGGFTIVVVEKDPDFDHIQKEVAWLPGFKSRQQAEEHIPKLRSFYNKYDYDIRVYQGRWYGPLRKQFDKLLWWEPLREERPREA